MTSPLLTVSGTTPVNFELRDGKDPEHFFAGHLELDVDYDGSVILNVSTVNGHEGAGLYLTRQAALDLAHYLINLVHPHAG